MKRILNNASQWTELPWVTLDEDGVYYSCSVDEVSFTFGTVDSHTKTKADAIIGDICYYGETSIGVVVIKSEETVKIMSLFDLNLLNYIDFIWGITGTSTNIKDENNGKANTAALIGLGSDYKAAIACSLYSTEGTSQGDWYLPAKNELNSISLNFSIIKESLNSIKDNSNQIWTDEYYWSSTEYDSMSAYYLYSNNLYSSFKSAQHKVRAFCEL